MHQRAPANGQRLFDLAQAEYWIGFVALEQGRYDESGVWFRKYRDSGIRLAAMDRKNFDWQREVAYGHQTLAVLDERRGRYAEAERAVREELALYRTWTAQRPMTRHCVRGRQVLSWLGTLSARQGKLADAEAFFTEQLAGMQRNIAAEPANAKWQDLRYQCPCICWWKHRPSAADAARLSPTSWRRARPRTPWPGRIRPTTCGRRHLRSVAGGTPS
jgi:tetratricopeptide (TPR) repeat protein